MKHLLVSVAATGLILLTAFSTTGCLTVIERAMEDRLTKDQVTDAEIGAGILSRFSDKDAGLLLDVNVDVWEQRVMLSGTLDNARMRQDVVQMVRADSRVREVYNEIQIVTEAEKQQRREASKNKDKPKKEGAA